MPLNVIDRTTAEKFVPPTGVVAELTSRNADLRTRSTACLRNLGHNRQQSIETGQREGDVGRPIRDRQGTSRRLTKTAP